MLVRNARAAGFSVLELMIVVAIVGLLAAVAFPSFREALAMSRMKTLAADIHLSMLRARSEAIKRNGNVTVAATDGNWLSGWTVSDDIEVHDAVEAPSLTISGSTSVTFTPNGRSTTTPVFVNLVSTETALVRCVNVSLSGQPVIKDGTCS
jgi:type IV fimbrial biogenesis protein FimT